MNTRIKVALSGRRVNRSRRYRAPRLANPSASAREDIVSLRWWPQFRMVEAADADGVLRLTLLGELDIAVVDQLTLQLERLQRAGEKVRVDLSRLEFIDARGFAALMCAVSAGRSADGDLVEVAPNLSNAVRRLFDLLGAGPTFWPNGAT
jgi:anti-anti-sigma factor